MQLQVSLVDKGRGRFDKEAEGNVITGEMLALKMEGRPRNRGCKKRNSRNWKIQINGFSLRTSKGSRALLTP